MARPGGVPKGLGVGEEGNARIKCDCLAFDGGSPLSTGTVYSSGHSLHQAKPMGYGLHLLGLNSRSPASVR